MDEFCAEPCCPVEWPHKAHSAPPQRAPGELPGWFIPGATFGHITEVRIPGLFDLGKLIGRHIAIRVDDQPQWTGLAQYVRLDGECTTSLTLTEPITVPWPTPAQHARLAAPTQFRLIADVLLARRLDEPHADDDTAVVW